MSRRLSELCKSMMTIQNFGIVFAIIISIIALGISVIPIFDYPSDPDIDTELPHVNTNSHSMEYQDFGIVFRQIIVNPTNAQYDIKLQDRINITITNDKTGETYNTIGSLTRGDGLSIEDDIIHPGEVVHYRVGLHFLKDSSTSYENGTYHVDMHNKYVRMSNSWIDEHLFKEPSNRIITTRGTIRDWICPQNTCICNKSLC